MKIKKSLIPSAALLLVLSAAGDGIRAQSTVRVPRPSQKASVMQTIGVTDVTVIYHRPGVKGRKIWGDAPAGSVGGTATLDDARSRPKDAVIVPNGHLWRAGANEATLFKVTDDVLVNGQPLPAGSYSLHMIPSSAEWTVIFNKEDGQWGSFNYDEKKDILRVKAKPEALAENQEWLAYTIDPVAENSAQVNLRWERLRVPFTVEVKDVNAVTLARARAAVAAAKPDDWQSPLQAANWALRTNVARDEAMQWIEQSIKAKETINNLGAKARALAAQGKTAEAIAIGEKGVQVGKDAKADAQAIAGLEKQVAEWKAKK